MAGNKLQAGTVETTRQTEASGNRQIPRERRGHQQQPHAQAQAGQAGQHHAAGTHPASRQPGRNRQQGAHGHRHGKEQPELQTTEVQLGSQLHTRHRKQRPAGRRDGKSGQCQR
nr:hypothetical protein [uncultured Marinobacter sp.]